MKCSDCKRWETEGCINPEKKDLDYAETFACFVPKGEGVEGMVRKKVNLPMKTRIDIWVVMIVAVVVIFGGIGLCLSGSGDAESVLGPGTAVLIILSWVAIFVVSGALFFLSAFFFSKLKRWAWIAAIVILLLELLLYVPLAIYDMPAFFGPVSFACSVAIILAIFDVKNYWKLIRKDRSPSGGNLGLTDDL